MSVDVRVLSPGDAGSVAQTNGSSATSTASNSARSQGATSTNAEAQPDSAAPAQEGTNSQTAGASATAVQTSSTNLNASVRVEEPGTNGTVTQTNSSSASADASNSIGSTHGENNAGVGEAPPYGESNGGEQYAGATATSTQTGAANVNFSLRLYSPGDNGQVTQTNSSVASTDAGNTGPSATTNGGPVGPDGQATQVDPSNTNITLRILSPGTNGAVTQTNTCSSSEQKTSGGVSSQAQVDCSDPSESLQSSTAQVADTSTADATSGPDGHDDTVWTWNWNWNLAVDKAGNFEWAFDPSSGAGWTWNWDGTNAAVEPATELSAGPQAGTWNWAWNWTWTWSTNRDWNWNWSWDSSRGSNWTWVWNWVWTAPPAAGVGDSSSEGADAVAWSAGGDSVEQSNETVARARARNENTFGQEVDSSWAVDGEAADVVETLTPTRNVRQRTENTQSADADASATQTGTRNGTDWGSAAASGTTPAVSPPTVSRVNRAAAEAIATNENRVTQTIDQIQGSADASVHALPEATQLAVNEQDAIASAVASQSSAAAVYPGSEGASAGAVMNVSSVVAIARNVNEAAQEIGQLQTALANGNESAQSQKVAQQDSSNQSARAATSSSLDAEASVGGVEWAGGFGSAAIANAEATNRNATTQTADQSESTGDGRGAHQSQAIDQSIDSTQSALVETSATSDGGAGLSSYTSVAVAQALAVNASAATQDASQRAVAGAGNDGEQTQTIEQSIASTQSATTYARVTLADGTTESATSYAGNANDARQGADQTVAGGSQNGATQTQSTKQSITTMQTAQATVEQYGGPPALGAAVNASSFKQTIGQRQSGGSGQSQQAEQRAVNGDGIVFGQQAVSDVLVSGAGAAQPRQGTGTTSAHGFVTTSSSSIAAGAPGAKTGAASSGPAVVTGVALNRNQTS